MSIDACAYRTNAAAILPQHDPDDINPGYGVYNARIAYDPPSGDWQQLGVAVASPGLAAGQRGTRGGASGHAQQAARVGNHVQEEL